MSMKTNATYTIRILATAAALLWAVGVGHLASAGTFADEIAAEPTDPHYTHNHSGETNTDIDGAGIDAGCEALLPDTNCPEYQYSILLDSDFTGATFAGADLDDITLLRNDFTDADLRRVDMRRAWVRGGSFEGADFSDALLVDSRFRCIDDPDDDGDASLCPVLIQTDFSDADLTGASISATFDDNEILLSGAVFKGAILVDAVWAAIAEPCIQTDEENNEWTCIDVGAATFGALDAATVDALLILNTSEVTSDLRGSNWHNLTLRKFELIGTRIAGASFAGSTIENADFRFTSTICRIDDGDDEMCDGFEAAVPDKTRTDFSGATIRDAQFDQADLAYADFTDAILEQVVFDSIDRGCSVEPDPLDVSTCDDCVNFAGAFDGQVAQGDGSYNISIQGVDWDRLLACSAIVATPLVDDLSHMQLDAGSFRETDVTAVDFVGSSLVGVSFEEATISNVSFDDAILTGANFNNAIDRCDAPADCTGFASATFDRATLTAAVLSNTDFASGSFDEANLDGAVAVNTDFSGASFDGSVSSPTSMVGINVSTSNFDGATFVYADLSSAQGFCDEIDDVEVCTSFVGVAFSNTELVDADFTGADFSGATFPGSHLSGAELDSITVDATTSFSGAWIDGIDLSGVDLQDAAATLFQGKEPFEPGTDQDASDAVGVDLSSRDLSDFDFSDLELINWNFASATLDNADFSGTGTDLTGASFQNVQFDTVFSTLGYENDFFSGTDLTSADLRGLDLTGFDLSGANLTGATVSATLFVDAILTGTQLVDLDRICDGTDCAEITGAMLDCAELRLTDYDDFLVRDGATPVTDDKQLFQFTDPDLSGLQLTSQNLFEFDFSGVDLSRANFDQNDVRLADFTDADLAGTLFTNATVCATSGDADCAVFSSTDLVGSTDCDDQEGANFTGVSFVNAPRDLFEGTIVGASAECVNFTNADLSLPEDPGVDPPTSGFDFTDFTDFTGAVLAGATLRHQDFSDAGDFPDGFFAQFSHAPESVDGLCSDEDDDVAEIDDRPDFRDTVFSCADLTNKQFTDAVMNGAEFVQTDLTGASFTDATLFEANFTDVEFTNGAASLFQDLTNAPDPDDSDEDPDDRVDEDGIPYPNLQRVNFSFADLDQSPGNFDLNHVDLLNANLSGARFINVDLRDAIMDAPVSLCDDADGDSTTCSPEVRTEQSCLDITGAMVEGTSFRYVQFSELFEFHPDGVDAARLFFQGISGGNLRGTNFTGSNIAGLDFSGLDMTDAAIFAVSEICDTSEDQDCASFEDTTFASTDANAPLNMTSIDFDEASIAGAQFDHVDLSSSDFSGVGDLCTAGDDCLAITGEHTRLLNTVFDQLDLTRVDFGANGTSDAVTQFTNASFVGADLSELALHARDFTNADFTGADLSDIDLEGSTVSGATFGCNDDDGCSILDGAALCGIDATSTLFEGTFDGTDFLPDGCSEAANLRGAVFTDSQLATLDLSTADLEAATFDASVDLCNDSGDCLTIDGANLIGVDFTGVDFDEVPAAWFQDAGIRNLGETTLASTDLSGKLLALTRFDHADFTGADLRNADLWYATFDNAQFASGGSSSSGNCTLASGTTRVDLRGADLRGADFSRARNFHRGCVRMDSTTVYDATTRFPAGFDLLGDITLIPEPRGFVLQVAALLTLALLATRRRHSSPA